MRNYGNNMLIIVCKFVYFDEKLDTFKNMRSLKHQKNNLNRSNIEITERLPEQDAVIKKTTNDIDLISITHTFLLSTMKNVGAKQNLCELTQLINFKRLMLLNGKTIPRRLSS